MKTPRDKAADAITKCLKFCNRDADVIIMTTKLKARKQPSRKAGTKRLAAKIAKLRVSTALTTKAWILPDGKFSPCGGVEHQHALREGDLVERFNLVLDDEVSLDDRLVALNAGFTRVNYERNNGALHIETSEKFWRKDLKDTLFTLIADNLELVDTVEVTVLTEAGDIALRNYAQLFNYDGGEKLNYLPF